MGSSKQIAQTAVSPLTGIGAISSDPFRSPKIQPDTLDPLRPEYRGLSSDLGAYGRTLVGQPGTPYTGNFTAPLSGGENDILSQINRMVAGGDGMSQLPFGDQRSSLISDILGGKRLNPASNPYLDAMIGDITKRSNQALGGNLNMVDAAFGRGGMTGASSGRSTQAIQASRLAAGDLQGQIAQILGNNYQQGLGEQMQTLGQILPGMDQQRSNNLFSALGANALPRQIQQNDLTSQYNEFIRQLTQGMGNTQMASQILGSSPGFQFSNPQYAPSQFSQIMNGVGSVGQALLPFALA